MVDVKYTAQLPSVQRAIKRKRCASEWTSTAGLSELKSLLRSMGFSQPRLDDPKKRNRVYSRLANEVMGANAKGVRKQLCLLQDYVDKWNSINGGRLVRHA